MNIEEQSPLKIITQCISDTLIKGSTFDGNLIVVDPTKHLELFKPHIQEYVRLSDLDKLKIMDLFAGLTGIWYRIPISIKDLPSGNSSRFVCSRKTNPKHCPELKVRARKNNSYGCTFKCTLDHKTGILTFSEHCQECLENKEESTVAIQSKLSVQKQITSPTKV